MSPHSRAPRGMTIGDLVALVMGFGVAFALDKFVTGFAAGLASSGPIWYFVKRRSWSSGSRTRWRSSRSADGSGVAERRGPRSG